VSQQSVSDCDYESTGEFRLIPGVMGETVSVPLVRVTLQSRKLSLVYVHAKWYLDLSSRLATIDMGRKWGAVHISGELGPHLTQCGRGLPLCQVSS